MTNHEDPLTAPDSETPGESKRPAAARQRNKQTFSTAVGIIARARDELQHLTGYKVDSVSGFERADDGWRLTITVVELRRIPSATDVLATYEVTLNAAGDIITYHRGGRYFRGQVGEIQ